MRNELPTSSNSAAAAAYLITYLKSFLRLPGHYHIYNPEILNCPTKSLMLKTSDLLHRHMRSVFAQLLNVTTVLVAK